MTKNTERSFPDVPWPPLRLDERNHLLVLADEARRAFEKLTGLEVEKVKAAARAPQPELMPEPRILPPASTPRVRSVLPPSLPRAPVRKRDLAAELGKVVRDYTTWAEQIREELEARASHSAVLAQVAGRIRERSLALLDALHTQRETEASLLQVLHHLGWDDGRRNLFRRLLTDLADVTDLIELDAEPTGRKRRGGRGGPGRDRGGRRPEPFRPAVLAAAELLRPVSRGDVRFAVTLLFAALELVDDLCKHHADGFCVDFDTLKTRVRVLLPREEPRGQDPRERKLPR